MSYLIIACFSVFLFWSSGVMERDNTLAAQEYQTSTQRQQASETIRYLNNIVDYLYHHPLTDGVIADSELDVAPPPGVAHVIQGGRIFVYQLTTPALTGAMNDLSGRSALLGITTSRRLIDLRGTDMQVTVPDVIPDGHLVYLN